MATITNRQINRKLQGSNSGCAVMDSTLAGFVNIHRADVTIVRCQRQGWQALGTASESSPKLSHASLPQLQGLTQDDLLTCCFHVISRATSSLPLSVFHPFCQCLSRHGVEHLPPPPPPDPPPPHLPPPRYKQCAPLPCGVGAKFCQPCPHFLPSCALGGRKQYRLPISAERRPKLQSEIKKITDPL